MSMTAEQGAALGEAIAKSIIGRDRAMKILPYYLGGFFDAFFLGIVVNQFITYIPFIKGDKKHIVAFVFAAMACTLAATIDILLWLSTIFVWEYGEFMSFSKGNYIYRYVVIDMITTFVVQSFYVDRAYRLHRHWWPLALLGTVVATALGVGAGFISVIAKKFEQLDGTVLEDRNVKTMAYLWLSLVVLADLSITIVMTHGLWKNKTGWKHTDSHLRGLVVKCFEAQVPALMIAVITLVFWNQMLEIAILFLMMHTKVYTLGLLVTLNFRVKSGSVSGVQSYNSDATVGTYNMSDKTSKTDNVVIIDQETAVSVDQGHHWNISKRDKVMDVEQGSANSTHTTEIDHRSQNTHPFARWDSTASLNEVSHVRGSGRDQ